MSTGSTAGELSALLDAATSPEEVRRVLAAVAPLPRTHPDAVALGAVEGRAFDYLRRVTATRPDEAAKVLRDDLLPRCLAYGEEAGEAWPRYAGLFGDWVAELPAESRAAVRRAGLAAAVAQLDAGNVLGGLRVIDQIGYADPGVCERLDALYSGRADELADRALGVRSRLGVPDSARERLASVLH